MQLKIFDVEHGACALLTADNAARLMIDCGHNAHTGWRPGTYLRSGNVSSLEMLAITNYDEDHASGIPNLFDNVSVQSIMRNPSVSAATICRLKSEDGMGPGIGRLAQWLATLAPPGVHHSPAPLFQGLSYWAFWCDYPLFEDENNLSMVLFLRCNGVGVMFPGDLERPGFRKLLERPEFREALRGTNIYVASHHGRENGCSEEAAEFLTNVTHVVISDCGYEYETQKTLPFYSNIAKGGLFRGGVRRVLTTRKDGLITFDFTSWGWKAS